MPIEKSLVGDLINFRGLVYAPVNENGVIFLFGKVVEDFNMYIEEVKTGFPDCIARRFIGKGWERVSIEFEYKSSSFVQHGHDPRGCDLIVCWEHDWKDCPLEVIELRSEIQGLENYLISRPSSDVRGSGEKENTLETVIKSISAIPKVKEWYEDLFRKLLSIDDQIWAKIGKKFIGWYCPERAFASLILRKTSIRIECYSGNEPIDGTRVFSTQYAPRWSAFSIKSDSDVEIALNILKESYKRIKEALTRGETTGYFSGGEPTGEVKTEVNSSEKEEYPA